MKASILYHRRSDHGGMVADYVHEFESYKAKQLELISLETVEGADLAKLYGITSYPAIIVRSDDGSLQRLWQGTPLPLMDELSYYVERPQPVISHMARTVVPLTA